MLTMVTLFMLAAASFLTSPVEEIVLRSGTVIAVEELVRVERGRLVFANSEGTLYSIRLGDVDVDATDARLPANRRPIEASPQNPVPVVETVLPVKLPVSEEEKRRILEEMEGRSHTGKAKAPATAPSTDRADLDVSVKGETDEWKWRADARRHREAVASARERLDAARKRERELNDLLLFFAGASGDASNYSYLVYQLSDLRSMIPRLEGDLRRAEDAWRLFQDDARRQGILPGWLR